MEGDLDPRFRGIGGPGGLAGAPPLGVGVGKAVGSLDLPVPSPDDTGARAVAPAPTVSCSTRRHAAKTCNKHKVWMNKYTDEGIQEK